MPTVIECEIVLGGERMEKVKQFRNLGTALCKYGKSNATFIDLGNRVDRKA